MSVFTRFVERNLKLNITRAPRSKRRSRESDHGRRHFLQVKPFRCGEQCVRTLLLSIPIPLWSLSSDEDALSTAF